MTTPTTSQDLKSVRRKPITQLTLLLLLVFLAGVPITEAVEDERQVGGDPNDNEQQTLEETMEVEEEMLVEKTSGDEDASPSSESSLSDSNGGKDTLRTVSLNELKVIELTSRNFDQTVNDGSLWLVEFMAPWCSHCLSFESSYEEVAHYFHASTQSVKVAKVNADSERALANRFGVQSYPSFYVIDGWSVYSFESSRSKRNLIRFVEADYKKLDPIPFYASPMGPLGLLQGTAMRAGMFIGDLFTWLQSSLGLSPLFAGALMFGSTFMGCFLTIVFLAIVITPKAKVD